MLPQLCCDNIECGEDDSGDVAEAKSETVRRTHLLPLCLEC
jgi:hypothetical protein